jgi:sugar O-acyltransferase (sialic acid O-acetyltransferase NeuD family)
MAKSPGKVVVLGGGGHAKVVISTLRVAGWQIVAIFDNRPDLLGSTVLDIPVKGPLSEAPQAGCRAVIAIGDNRDRQRVASELALDWATVVHPRAWVDHSVPLGPGTVVFAGAVIQPDTQVGQHAVLNSSVSVDHDCVVGDFAHLAPGVRLAGGVRIGEGALVGVGSTATVGVRIGEWSTVGAGAVVIRDVEAQDVVIGVPARPIVRGS